MPGYCVRATLWAPARPSEQAGSLVAILRGSPEQQQHAEAERQVVGHLAGPEDGMWRSMALLSCK